jgi:hypothetical protein
MPTRRDPETGKFSDNKLGATIFFGFVAFMIFFMIGSENIAFIPFAFAFFFAYIVVNIFRLYAFGARKIAQSGKLSEGTVTGISAKPFAGVGKKTIKIRFEFYDGRTVYGETPWLTFSELDCPYFIGKDIRVAHIGDKSVIIKRIYDLSGKIYYSVYENAANETGDIYADKDISGEKSGAAKGIYTDGNIGQKSGAARGIYTDTDAANARRNETAGKRSNAAKGIYDDGETIEQRAETIGKKIDAEKDKDGAANVRVLEYDAFEKRYTAALPVLMKEHEEHRKADAEFAEKLKAALIKEDGENEKDSSVPFETIDGSIENRGIETTKITNNYGTELPINAGNYGGKPTINAGNYGIEPPKIANNYGGKPSINAGNYGIEPLKTISNYGGNSSKMANGIQPPITADKNGETAAFRVSEIKDKYAAVEIISEIIGASKYDVRAKIETGNAVFEIPIEMASEAVERLGGIAVLTEN